MVNITEPGISHIPGQLREQSRILHQQVPAQRPEQAVCTAPVLDRQCRHLHPEYPVARHDLAVRRIGAGPDLAESVNPGSQPQVCAEAP